MTYILSVKDKDRKFKRKFDRYDEWISVTEALPEDFDNLCEYDAYLICSTDKKKFPGTVISIGTNTGPDRGWEILGNGGYWSDTGYWELKSEDITHWKYINTPIQPSFQRFTTFDSTVFRDVNIYIKLDTNNIEKLRDSLKYLEERIEALAKKDLE